MSFVFAPPQQAVVPVQDETYSYFPIRRVFGIARNYAEPGAATKDTPFYFMKDCYTVVPVADGECARIPMPPQVPVKIMSPGWSSQNLESSTIVSRGWTIRLDVQPPWRFWLLT